MVPLFHYFINYVNLIRFMIKNLISEISYNKSNKTQTTRIKDTFPHNITYYFSIVH